MAKASGVSARQLLAEYSLNGTDFTSVAGANVAIEPSGEDRAYAEQPVFEVDDPVIGYGKLSAADVMLRAVYTQTDSEIFDVLYDAKIANSDIWLRWSVYGGNSGDKQYTVQGKVVECVPPGGEAGSADVVLFEARVIGAKYTESVVT